MVIFFFFSRAIDNVRAKNEAHGQGRTDDTKLVFVERKIDLGPREIGGPKEYQNLYTI